MEGLCKEGAIKLKDKKEIASVGKATPKWTPPSKEWNTQSLPNMGQSPYSLPSFRQGTQFLN